MITLQEVIDKELTYDEFYRRGQAILDKYNPCNISADGKTCNGGHPCCGGCRHLGATGCTVEALYCKLWLCGEAAHKFPECHKELTDLYYEARKQDIPIRGGRYSKTENFAYIRWDLEFPVFEEDIDIRSLI
jgi:hypothetical protein